MPRNFFVIVIDYAKRSHLPSSFFIKGDLTPVVMVMGRQEMMEQRDDYEKLLYCSNEKIFFRNTFEAPCCKQSTFCALWKTFFLPIIAGNDTTTQID
jgi:hypothetical protein